MKMISSPKAILGMALTVLTLYSCSKDEDEPTVNEPPSAVSNIKAAIISGTDVRISWSPATDKNKDNLSYEVIVNDKVMAKDVKTNSLEIDVSEFLPDTTGKKGKNGIKDFIAKSGYALSLSIEVKAYDGEGGVSSQEITQSVNVNRPPGSFSIANVYFDLWNTNYVQVNWYPSTDADGDNITYDVYLNDIQIGTEISISASEDFGYVEYNEDVSDILDDLITIRIVASDGSDQETEITQTFDFKATDVDLGELEMPFSEQYEYTIGADEADFAVAYTFSIADTVDYSISINNFNERMILADSTDTIVAEGFEWLMGKELLPGMYTLTIEDSYRDADEDFGTISLIMGDPKASDVELGSIEVPSTGSSDLLFNNEMDGKIVYYFEVEEATGYSFSNDIGASMTLLDEEGSEIAYGYRGILRGQEEISAGRYALRVFYQGSIEGTLNYRFGNPSETDVDLGIVSLPSEGTQEFDLGLDLDGKIVYTFETQEPIGYRFSSELELNYRLTDSNGNNIGYQSYTTYLSGFDLPVGSYSLEISLARSGTGIGTLNYSFIDPTLTDIDLGAVSMPSEGSESFDLENEFDKKINILFRTDEVTGYIFQVGQQLRMNLYDANGNSVDYLSNGEEMKGGNLPIGSYRLEISSTYSTQAGAITLDYEFKDAAATDVDWGTIAIPAQGTETVDLESELDEEIVYAFEIQQVSGYIFTSDVDFSYRLLDSNGNLVNSTSGSILRGGELALGVYYLHVSARYYGQKQGSLEYSFNDPYASDQDFGVLDTESVTETTFDFSQEPDGEINYNFQIDDPIGFAFYTKDNTYLNLYDSNGNFVASGYGRVNGEELLRGSYRLNLRRYDNENGTLSLAFDDSSRTDQDLGVLELPYFESTDLSFHISDPDDTIRYAFTTEEITDYHFSVSNGIRVRLNDSNGNYVNGGHSITSGSNLAAGDYYLLITAQDNYNGGETFTGSMSIQFNP
ncbi:MAG: fibronectin type III domain-containing protein [Bacteroidota bacterium]